MMAGGLGSVGSLSPELSFSGFLTGVTTPKT